MKKLEVKISGKNGELIETIPVRNTDNPESWLRDQPRHVVLNVTAYEKTDIVSVREVPSRKGSTNMEGV
jgi:hypothetical protein